MTLNLEFSLSDGKKAFNQKLDPFVNFTFMKDSSESLKDTYKFK